MKNITIKPNITIREAMKKLSKTGEKSLIITDKNNKLLGTLSDGDVRKAILKGRGFGDSIESIYKENPTKLLEGSYSLRVAKQLFIKHKFDLIPIIDKNEVLKDILFLESLFKDSEIKNKYTINIPVVIMAGGRGTRLEPFTKVLPKPLVPIHDKPVIEHIIERFTDVGCIDFYLTTNYKGRILKAYFEELQSDYKTNFVDEKEPLGTAGSLRYLKGKFNSPFFVTNCDIIVDTDYSSLYEFHKKGGYDATLVASTKEYIIPYGTCELNKAGDLSHINEKPSYDFLINTGLYVLNPDILSLIPKNKFYHITHLIEDLKKQGKKIGVFPIDDESWMDVGQWAEYRKALERL